MQLALVKLFAFLALAAPAVLAAPVLGDGAHNNVLMTPLEQQLMTGKTWYDNYRFGEDTTTTKAQAIQKEIELQNTLHTFFTEQQAGQIHAGTIETAENQHIYAELQAWGPLAGENLRTLTQWFKSYEHNPSTTTRDDATARLDMLSRVLNDYLQAARNGQLAENPTPMTLRDYQSIQTRVERMMTSN